MIKTPGRANLQSGRILVSTGASRAIDGEARAEWGFNEFALVEAAGRFCAQRFAGAFPELFKARPRITVAAGTGNNAADAMVMLRHWILAGLAGPSSSAVVLSRASTNGASSPGAELLVSFRKMQVPLVLWDGDITEAAGRVAADILARSDIIVDGIAGTGLNGALGGTLLEMVNAINACRRPFVVSVDMPSGNSDHWKPGMPIVRADATLAIEPRKLCNYTPAARPCAGVILPVGGIFPDEIIARHSGAEILDWNSARERVSKIKPHVYKNKRGAVEIRAGSTGTSGAALIAARGAQAAGAGLVRLVVDDDIHPILASQAGGVMVFPASADGGGFRADAVLLGPGWGKGQDRLPVLKRALETEGIALILDADAIGLAGDTVFGGNAILTPHPGEFSCFSGIEKEELLCNPGPTLLTFARQQNAVILFKGHVITIAAPDGRLGVVDGMAPVLAAGGSGDLLAGLCSAIAARMVREGSYCGYTCATVAAALFIELGSPERFGPCFTDPLELAGRAAALAGEAWLTADIPADIPAALKERCHG